jgi:phosphoribosyl-ATP pyrophosphohydrolase/phosphoribosyl-AMP cyclohydrolase
MRPIDINEIDFEKGLGLVPAIIQDYASKTLLMLGYMNKESLEKTLEDNEVYFYSRSKQRIWKKGETSGNCLIVKEISMDCDSDALLIKVKPLGPVCHMGSDTCWNERNEKGLGFLIQLENIIEEKRAVKDTKSYTNSLFVKGINAIAQKVGEEAIELVIEAKDENKDLFLNEAADLLYHYLVLLQAKESRLEDVISILRTRNK